MLVLILLLGGAVANFAGKHIYKPSVIKLQKVSMELWLANHITQIWL